MLMGLGKFEIRIGKFKLPRASLDKFELALGNLDWLGEFEIRSVGVDWLGDLWLFFCN